jgi:hypothetical protein
MLNKGISKSKKWGKPKLLILVRGDSGENVLSACKTSSFCKTTSTGPGTSSQIPSSSWSGS